jgi:hypothetical protein
MEEQKADEVQHRQDDQTTKRPSPAYPVIDHISYIMLLARLDGGDTDAVTIWRFGVWRDQIQENFHFIGSDLIYSIHVVRPLFLTSIQFLQ